MDHTVEIHDISSTGQITLHVMYLIATAVCFLHFLFVIRYHVY